MKTETRTEEERTLLLENLLREARSEADRLRKRLDTFEQIMRSTRLIMGHEIKKPATAITGYLELLREDIEPVCDEATIGFLEKATDECELLNELNEFFLELLRTELDEERLGHPPVNIERAVEQVIDRLPEELKAAQRVKVSVGDNIGTSDILKLDIHHQGIGSITLTPTLDTKVVAVKAIVQS